jgi:FkbM family methyltransferase
MGAGFLLKKWVKARMSRLFTNYVGAASTGILVDMGDLKLLTPISDLSLARHLSQNNAYNKPLVDFLLKQITAESSVLFIGTHIGSVLIPIAQRCRSVVGVEANPDTFKLLEQNLVLNGVTNTKLHNQAAFDKKGELTFMATRDNTGGSKVQPQTKGRFEFEYDAPTVIKVPAKKLDEVLEGQTFGLVVMDIEGSEWRALKGMPTLMKNVSKLVLEILPNHLENVAGVSPADFFSALPAHFTSARPINVPEMKEHYSKNDFLAMYAAVVKHHFMDGIDVIFSA